MVYLKPIVAIATMGGMGGAIGALVHLNSSNKASTSTNVDVPNSSLEEPKREEVFETVWRNYLVQAKSAEPTSPPTLTKVTCEFGEKCNLYLRNDSEDAHSLKTNTSNLTKVDNPNTLINDKLYVLRIKEQKLKINNVVELTTNTQQNSWVQVISRMTMRAGALRMPKPPQKILPKTDWLGINTFTKKPDEDLSKMQNRFFRVKTYPTHIPFDNVDHKHYIVIKWQEKVTCEEPKNADLFCLHTNKRNNFYIPKQTGDKLNPDWQKTYNPSFNKTSSLYHHPFLFATLAEITNIKVNVDEIDFYLFKPFDEQKEEQTEVGKLEITMSKVKEPAENNASKTIVNKAFDGVFVEIYEIKDQANIAKSFTPKKDGTFETEKTDWQTIAKESLMITKLSELEHGKYYKFVFSSDEVAKYAFANKLISLYANMNQIQSTGDVSEEFDVFGFLGMYQDFYCVATEGKTKCEYFDNTVVTSSQG